MNYNVEIPAGITAYRATKVVDDKWIHMEQIDGVIPAQTAVILNGKADDYIFTYSATDTTQPYNLLKGTLWEQTIAKSNASYYVLANGEDGIGMYVPRNGENESEFTSHANKAYLHFTQASNVTSFTFRGMGNNGTTDIEDFRTEDTIDDIYDLTGRKIESITSSGLYIINREKKFVK